MKINPENRLFIKILIILTLLIVFYYFSFVIIERYSGNICQKYYCLETIKIEDFISIAISFIGLIIVLSTINTWKQQINHQNFCTSIDNLINDLESQVTEMNINHYKLTELSITKLNKNISNEIKSQIFKNEVINMVFTIKSLELKTQYKINNIIKELKRSTNYEKSTKPILKKYIDTHKKREEYTDDIFSDIDTWDIQKELLKKLLDNFSTARDNLYELINELLLYKNIN